ncbi:hypothetical protein JOC36_001484 [Weissella uvarum]|uniref:hypothetical protein n=1 Tax=Weissella uvarum TaxID=1479233 RepID=UPI001960AAE5|nr:hypothetical protein [Weissella uvarum]MBM7617891.1 hypothetical protein [Weissella uvarum]MCM0596111.1 hypothetical protein [Weissella uvarum]
MARKIKRFFVTELLEQPSEFYELPSRSVGVTHFLAITVSQDKEPSIAYRGSMVIIENMVDSLFQHVLHSSTTINSEIIQQALTMSMNNNHIDLNLFANVPMYDLFKSELPEVAKKTTKRKSFNLLLEYKRGNISYRAKDIITPTQFTLVALLLIQSLAKEASLEDWFLDFELNKLKENYCNDLSA